MVQWQHWLSMVVPAIVVGIAGGIISARITVATLSNDMTWVKQQLTSLWNRIDRLDDKLEIDRTGTNWRNYK
jgi:uncharacterized membrane-anchored protein YhcB (DUF1043 family)